MKRFRKLNSYLRLVNVALLSLSFKKLLCGWGWI